MNTIADLVERASDRFSSRIAVVDGARTLTFADVGDRSARLANVLLGLSQENCSRVAVLMGNRLEVVEVDFAIARAGKVKAPINPRLTDDERRFMLANCGAEIVVTDASDVARVEALQHDLPALRHILNVDDAARYDDLIEAANPSRPDIAIDLDQPSMILHTSGTTGRPKGATTTQRARVLSTVNMLLDEFMPNEDDGMIHVAPMSHGSGSKILSFYTRGARNITLSRFDPELFFQAVTTKGGTSTFLVPTMIRMLLDAPSRKDHDLSTLRNITYGGASMPTALAEEALDAFGPILTQVYGSCEAPHPVTSLSKADHLNADDGHLSSAGHATTGVQIRIVDASGENVAPGESGELLIRGDHLMSGYWNDEKATSEAFVDGWYRSGDVATLSHSGFLSIVGREREMLISGGFNVYPAEVEAALHRNLSISEAAVFGTPDALWGEVVSAAIVVRQGHELSELDVTNHCRTLLADYKIPRRVLFVDSLPKGNTGKVLKQELVDLATPSVAQQA
jgi:acyl-CoA synthetase (AMP-forming)/AMP-acid ligase II